MYKLILTLTLILASCIYSHACTLAWDAPTTYTDGTPVPSTEVITYRLYFTPSGATTTQNIYEGTNKSTTMVCMAGAYYVTAHTVTNLESGKSNTLQLKQASPPVNLRYSN